MPCQYDDMNPNAREVESQLVCSLLVYLLIKLKKTVPTDVTEGSRSYYGVVSKLDAHTALLCSTLKNMTKEQHDKITYNGRVGMSRTLANWWDKHQQADKEREAMERAERTKKRTRQKAMAKLTPAERRALDLE